MGKRETRVRVIPEQDGRIIGAICVCQLTMILSGVALVYLSVAVYSPSHKAFHSGFDPVPVVCETVNTTVVNNCPWTSCSEWCLTRPSGFCEQILVTVRRHGSDLRLQNCTDVHRVSCPKANVDALSKANCHKSSECNHMHGLFSCSKGHCANISQLMQCQNHGEGPYIDVDKDSGKLTGNFQCSGNRCWKIKRQLECENICPQIRTGNNNVFLQMADDLIATNCSWAKISNYSAPQSLTTLSFGNFSNSVLFVSCYALNITTDSIAGTDCINGTWVLGGNLSQPTMNYSKHRELWQEAIAQNSSRSDSLPNSQLLSLTEGTSRLYINLDHCVNTLRGECKHFMERYGSDGRNHSARSRFPCFYNRNDSFMVLARFDLDQTWRELIVAVIVPVVLFVVSLSTLCIITRSVKVGDDAKLRCCCCSSRETHT